MNSLDPRCNSEEKIVPPSPLPYVSRKALARVKDYLPPPNCCPWCQKPVKLVNNSEVYGKEYGNWPYMYWCKLCDAYVGLHPDTDLPLGTLATREVRNARSRSKDAFHSMLKQLGINRDAGYKLVSAGLNIPAKECHFGWFDIPRAEEVKHFCNREIQKSKYPEYCK